MEEQEKQQDKASPAEAVVMCDNCNRPTKYCVCIYRSRMETLDARVAEAIDEAYRLRRLWQAAASCLLENHRLIKPRGPDESRMMQHAERADLGVMWSGTTDGWINDIVK